MPTPEALVSQLMSSPVVALSPDARVGEVRALARAKAVHHFPIIDEHRLIGIVCTCDLEGIDPCAHALASAWRHVVTLPPDSPASDAARLMMLHGVGSIVIADSEGVQGILTRQDVARASPALEGLLSEAHCAACGGRYHLRPGPEGKCLCVHCQATQAEGELPEFVPGH